jgi:hypothetical protein
MTVRKSLEVAFVLTVLTLAGAGTARAEGEAGGFAPAATGTGFGAPGQFVFSMGPTTDQHLFFHKEGGAWQLQLSPALDYFVTARLAVGGVLGYTHDSGGAGTGANANGTDTFRLGVRASTNLDINDRFSVWPLGGLFYSHTSQNHNSTNDTWIELYVPFLFHLAPHFFVGVGPSFQLYLHGPDNQYGIDSVLGGWF